MEMLLVYLCAAASVLGFGVYAAVLMGVAVWLSIAGYREGREQERRHRRYLDELGFRPVRDGSYEVTRDGVTVVYRKRKVNRGNQTEEWHDLGVSAPDWPVRITARTWHTDPAMGDAQFDAVYRVYGHLAERALLTAPVRSALIDIARRGSPNVETHPGGLWVERRTLDGRDLVPLVALARLLAEAPRDPEARLRRLAADPDPAVRATALDWSAEVCEPRAVSAIARPALAAADPAERVAAALALRAVGLVDAGVLAGLAEGALSAEVPLGARHRAAQALHAADPEVRLRVGAALLDEAPLRVRGIELLATVDGAEPWLLPLVPGSDSALLGAVLQALARVGSVAAVPVLRARQQELSLLQVGMSQAIDHAVRVIQRRSGGEGGGLALAELAPSGGLAIAAEQPVSGSLAEAVAEPHPAVRARQARRTAEP